MKGIVYTSNTGYTKQYAELLCEKTGLPVYSLKEAEKAIDKNSDVIYLGWLMAGKIKGCKKAAKRFCLRAVCAVGMGANGSQLDDVKKANKLPEGLPLFVLQGGFDMNKLHGIYKFMMKTMVNTVGKKYMKKTDRTEEEQEFLDFVTVGGNKVCEENLTDVLKWYGI